MKTYSSPPLIDTEADPVDIIRPDRLEAFTKHIRICSSASSAGFDFPEKELNKEIGKDNRAVMAGILAELRAHGYVPVINSRGFLDFRVMLKSAVQIEYERGLRDLQRLPLQKLQEMARSGYRMTVARQKQVDTCHGIGRAEIVAGQSKINEMEMQA